MTTDVGNIIQEKLFEKIESLERECNSLQQECNSLRMSLASARRDEREACAQFILYHRVLHGRPILILKGTTSSMALAAALLAARQEADK